MGALKKFKTAASAVAVGAAVFAIVRLVVTVEAPTIVPPAMPRDPGPDAIVAYVQPAPPPELVVRPAPKPKPVPKAQPAPRPVLVAVAPAPKPKAEPKATAKPRPERKLAAAPESRSPGRDKHGKGPPPGQAKKLKKE